MSHGLLLHLLLGGVSLLGVENVLVLLGEELELFRRLGGALTGIGTIHFVLFSGTVNNVVADVLGRNAKSTVEVGSIALAALFVTGVSTVSKAIADGSGGNASIIAGATDSITGAI